MNEQTRDRIQERLLEERQDRLEALAELDDRFKEMIDTEDGSLTKYPLHMADEGTDTMEQEKDFLLAHREGEELMEIDDALRKLYKDEPSFGTCERCGGEIGEERLDMVPWARHCIDCKRELEEKGEESAA